MKQKKQRGRFLDMLLGTLGASLLGNILAGKGTIVINQGRFVVRAGDEFVQCGNGVIRARQNF